MVRWFRRCAAADGGARACAGADGAVVLNLRRGPGAYALLSRADGQLTRAGQHYCSHLGLRPRLQPAPHPRGAHDYILLRNGQKKLVRSLQGGERRLTKLGQGLLPRQVLRVPGSRDHPWQAAQQAKRRGGLRAQGLAAADGVKPVDGVLPDLGFVEGCCDARQFCLNLLPYVGPGWYPKVSLAAMLDLRLPLGPHRVGASPRGATWTRRRCGARWSAWTPRGPRARSTWPSSA